MIGGSMVSLKELDRFLQECFPSNGVVDASVNGLQVEGKPIVCSVATAVSANLETLQAAVKANIDALIVHHGLFWQRDGYAVCGTKRKKLALLLEHGLSLFAYHLPMDMHAQYGNNWKAALDLGWMELQPFGYFNGVPIGVKGVVLPCSRDELKCRLEAYYQHPAVCAWGGEERVQKVALVSGGAHKTILEAAQEGVDAFVTGSFDEPVWHQAKEEEVNFYALGHSATERVGPQALAQHVEQVLRIPCRFLEIENPF